MEGFRSDVWQSQKTRNFWNVWPLEAIGGYFGPWINFDLSENLTETV